jgi:broad-specificity NMP kinase
VKALAGFDRALVGESDWSPVAQGLARELLALHEAAAGDPPGLARATDVFQLAPLECQVLLAALAPELDERYGALFVILQHDVHAARPTVGLLSRMLARSGATRAELGAALAPDGHLARTGLVELVGDGPRARRQLRIPEAFWPQLVGDAPAPEQPPAGTLDRLVLAPATLAAARAAIAWAKARPPAAALVAIEGAPGSGRGALAEAIAAELGYTTLDAPADADPRTLAREAAWRRAAVVVRAEQVGAACAEVSMPVIAIVDDGALPAARGERATATVAIEPLAEAERARLWAALLGSRASELAADVARRYRFGPGRMRAVVRAAATYAGAGPLRADDLLRAIRATAGAPGGLAVRLPCPFGADDLVVPPETRRELDLVLAWARRGTPVVALFSGPPGTGKTMAAQLLAHALDADLLRVDLSRIVDKYIGETEKNLERVFAEAEATGSVLLFDEADVLFGRRTEVRDAHDRYANQGTAFLLQRIERHPGVVVLATNLRANLDAAVFRRIQVIAEFPRPGVAERADIWRRHLRDAALAPDVDLGGLASRAPLAGGDIRNAALTAAVLAGAEPVGMRHLVVAAFRESRKLGYVQQPHDFEPWAHHLVAAGYK